MWKRGGGGGGGGGGLAAQAAPTLLTHARRSRCGPCHACARLCVGIVSCPSTCSWTFTLVTCPCEGRTIMATFGSAAQHHGRHATNSCFVGACSM